MYAVLQAERCRVPTSARQLLQSAWTELAPQLRRFVCASGLDRNRGEDVLQDVYLAALQKCPDDLDLTGLRRWLFKVAANRCNLEHRRHRSWRSALRGFARFYEDRWGERQTPCRALQNEQREVIREALTALAPRLRYVLVLRYYVPLDSKEIGKILNLPDSTVRSRIRRARMQLAEYLKQSGYEHE